MTTTLSVLLIDVHGAESTARKLPEDLARPIVIGMRPLAVRASIGIARFPEDGLRGDTLLRHADLAMYLAKADGSSVEVYRPDGRNNTHRRLALEITESLRLSDRAMGCLARLHERGIRIAVDDFGTGNSSLRQLRRLPVDELKLDRSFVADLEMGDDVVMRSSVMLAPHRTPRDRPVHPSENLCGRSIVTASGSCASCAITANMAWSIACSRMTSSTRAEVSRRASWPCRRRR